MIGALSGALAVLAGGVFGTEIWRKQAHRWIPAYFRWQPEPIDPDKTLHIYFCFVDHYEPLGDGVSKAKGIERVRLWLDEYPRLADPYRDTEGRPPQHSFFFPAEEYQPEFLDMLQQLCARGYGDVEIHLHHDNDTPENFVETMEQFIARLQQHGFLLNREPRHRFGFIHGNWCLDNSRRDGRWCGLNNEIDLLWRLGCYADFTFPSAPSETQPAMVNSIYYCRDDISRPKSHNTGRSARVGVLPDKDELCLITGPLGPCWHSRKFGVTPRIENGDINGGIVADAQRCRSWVRLGARVFGAPNHVFIKVHTHGTQERLYNAVLGEQARAMYGHLVDLQKMDNTQLHFVTAYEMWRAVRALEVGNDPLHAISGKKFRAGESRKIQFQQDPAQASPHWPRIEK